MAIINELSPSHQLFWQCITIAAASSAEDTVNAIGFITIRILTNGRWLALRLTAGCSYLAWTDWLTIHYGTEAPIWNHVKEYWFSDRM
jgi:ABC-type uncharacterized transport system permease subunit